jgi:hypothetical protein
MTVISLAGQTVRDRNTLLLKHVLNLANELTMDCFHWCVMEEPYITAQWGEKSETENYYFVLVTPFEVNAPKTIQSVLNAWCTVVTLKKHMFDL